MEKWRLNRLNRAQTKFFDIMAQHFLINDKYVGENENETKSIRRIIRQIRSDIRKVRETEDETDFNRKYNRLPDDYLEGTETEAYITYVDVPESLVYGGRASIELHFRMSVLSKIYLVA